MKSSFGLCVCLGVALVLLVAEATMAEDSPVAVTVVPRKMVWTAEEAWYFDVHIKNATGVPIKVPYIYDSTIEIDGQLFTQFPKPVLSPEPHRVFAARSDGSHGTLTLNGKLFETVDAKTGKTPLRLKSGPHTLVLKLGDYSSAKIPFSIRD